MFFVVGSILSLIIKKCFTDRLVTMVIHCKIFIVLVQGSRKRFKILCADYKIPVIGGLTF